MGTNAPQGGLVLSVVFLHLEVAVVLMFPQIFEYEPRWVSFVIVLFFIPADVCSLSKHYYFEWLFRMMSADQCVPGSEILGSKTPPPMKRPVHDIPLVWTSWGTSSLEWEDLGPCP